jgi:hypothetical protein
LPLGGPKHDLNPANERLRTAMTTHQAFQARPLKWTESNWKRGRTGATGQ